jgi:predicted dehydrogenase
MSTEGSPTIRIGCLGAARIAPAALIRPARNCAGVEVKAIAARDEARAEAFASKHGVPRVYGSYRELVEADDLDAVYVPLPNGLHAEWTIAAIEAGKHVLCEKPFTANAGEAERVRDIARRSDRVVMEAFHWRYHPLAQRLLDVISSGDLGRLTRIEAALVFPLPRWSDIRWQLGLAGGSLMDAGCYPVHIVRTLAGTEPGVSSARAKVRTPQVDRWIRAELDFGDGVTGRVTAGMWASPIFRAQATVRGSAGTMTVLNPLAPQFFNLLTVKAKGQTRRERVRGQATYDYQMQAFADAIRDGKPFPTRPDDSVANMRAIDAIYEAAGLEPRRGSTDPS